MLSISYKLEQLHCLCQRTPPMHVSVCLPVCVWRYVHVGRVMDREWSTSDLLNYPIKFASFPELCPRMSVATAAFAMPYVPSAFTVHQHYSMAASL